MKSKANSQVSNSTTNVQNKVPTGGGGGTRAADNKPQPTAEQIRYAKLSQLAGQEDHKIQEKIKQVADITRKSPDTVAMALHEANYDESAAIQTLIDGDYDEGVEWKTTASKKKKPTVLPSATKTPNEPTPDTGPTVNHLGEELEQKPSVKPPTRGGRGGRRGRGRRLTDDKAEEKMAENEVDQDRERTRAASEKGRGRGKLLGRPQSRGRGRSAGFGSKSSFGRGGSRSRGRQLKRGRGRGGFGSADHDSFVPKTAESQDLWDDDEDDKPKITNWGDSSESSPEQPSRPEGDWGEQMDSHVGGLFFDSSNKTALSEDSWKHSNGPQGGWLEKEGQLKTDDASYLPENVDDAVILSKRAPHATKSEATSYHSTSEMSRATYASLQNNQFPSSNPETSLTSGLSSQTYQIESLLKRPLTSSDSKDCSSIPVISGIQDSRKLEQEQLQGAKTQKQQKAKRTAKIQLPCQPVEMPRSMMHELDKQLSELQFGSSPLGSNLSQESVHNVPSPSTVSVFSQSTSSDLHNSTAQDASRHVTVSGSLKTPIAHYNSGEDFASRAGETARAERKSELSETPRVTTVEYQEDVISSFVRQEEHRSDGGRKDFTPPSSTLPETTRFNGVSDIRDSGFSQKVDTDALARTSVQEIRRQNETSRSGLHSDVNQVTAINELQKSISQRSDVSQDRLNMGSDVSRAYMTDVSRQRKAQPQYPTQEAVRHGVRSDQSRFNVPRPDVHKQSPPLTSHDPMRHGLRSESTRTSMMTEMRHTLAQGSRRQVTQESTRHDGVAEVTSMPPSLSKPDKPKTPPGLSSLHSGSTSRDVAHLGNVTTALSMAPSNQTSLTNSFGSVSRGASAVYVSSSGAVSSSAQTSTVLSNAAPSVGINGTTSFTSPSLTTIGFTSGTTAQTGLKTQTATSKASGPPGMLPLNLNTYVQQGLIPPQFTHQAIAAPPYFDEMQMMPRMQMSPFYETMMYTAPAGNARENIQTAHTYQGTEGKFARDNSSPVASSINQGTPHAPHPQATIFAGTPAPVQYGYAYYPPHGVIPGGFPVFTTAPVFQMGGSKGHMGASNQYQSGYAGQQASHAYNSVGSQDFSKSTYHNSVGQSNPHKTNQGVVTLTSGTSATDSVHHSSAYKVQFNQDSKSFVNGTPPPLRMGVQHGQSHLGSYHPQYVMQHPSLMPGQHVGHHQLDSSGQGVHGGRPQQHHSIGGSQQSKHDLKNPSYGSYWSSSN